MKFRLLGLAVSMVGVIASCAPAPEPQTSTSSDPVIVRLPAAPSSWNPLVERTASSKELLAVLYPKLLQEIPHEGESRFEPWLADRWDRPDNGLSITFYLNRNAQWSDGTPIDCEDVRFSFLAQTDSDVGWAGAKYKSSITGVDCLASHEVRFEFALASPNQLADANDGGVLPKQYGAIPFDSWKNRTWLDELVTAGPFRLARYETEQQIHLEPDPNWWRSPALLSSVVFKVLPDAATAQLELQSGSIHVVPSIQPSSPSGTSESVFDELLVGSNSFLFVAWNQLLEGSYRNYRDTLGCGQDDTCSESLDALDELRSSAPHPLFQDQRIRHALTLAIDRNDLNASLFESKARVPATPILPASWAYDKSVKIRFNLDRAAELLENAGFDGIDANGIRIRSADGTRLAWKLLVYADNPTMVGIGEQLKSQLKAIGAEVTLDRVSRAQYIERAWDKNFESVIGAWRVGSRVEPELWFATESALDRGNNWTAWSSPLWDQLFASAAASTSRQEAAEHWAVWQRSFVQEQPYTILAEPVRRVGVSRKLAGLEPNAFQTYQGMEHWRWSE